jgi:hypothetical protein
MNAFDHFITVLEYFRAYGTYAVTPLQIDMWNMKEVGSGTHIGYCCFEEGTVGHLSVGRYEMGTSYPRRFGMDLKLHGDAKLFWFDWDERLDIKHSNPHIQFQNSQKIRYKIFDSADWIKIRDGIESIKRSYWTTPK